MTVWLIAGVVTLCVTALLALMIYANHAGKNAARVKASEQDAEAARQAAETAQRMAQAEAGKPVTKAALLQRLDEGDA